MHYRFRYYLVLQGCIQKFLDQLPGVRTAYGTALCHWVYCYFVSQSVRYATITLGVASKQVFVVVVYFIINSVWKLLETPLYKCH
jgi:hypothetical protein